VPLQNRVDPFGDLHAVAARGALMGNRGGRFHRDDKTLGARRWAGCQWIACVCAFKNRRREVWGRGYTELFFLDEATAFAAGHRPCFECRRADAVRFAVAFGEANATPPADAIDRILHAERLDGRAKRRARRALNNLPDGAFVVIEGAPWLVCGAALYAWSFVGYGVARPRAEGIVVDVLTPASILAAFANGYAPAIALTGAP
jgi:hypothetical protein